MPVHAAMRELAEETGTDKARVIGETRCWYDYDLPAEAIGKFWGGKYRGQTQKWFALRFTGTDGDINPGAVDHPEFDDWKWVEADRLVELIVPFKRPVYTQVLAELGPLARPVRALG
jgi:putative (di)nucleoside polyphosphate hydrolase